MTTSAHRFLAKMLAAALARSRRAFRSRGVRKTAELSERSGHHHDLSETDIMMMKRAIELAGNAAAIGEVPVGAVIYRGSQIIAEAYNLREAAGDPTAHAELLAISQAGKNLGEWRLSDCSLAVTLEPCPMCAGAMVNARLGRLIYGATDPKAGACHTLYRIPADSRLNHRVEMIGGVMAEQCAKLLTDFFQQRRRIDKQSRQARSA